MAHGNGNGGASHEAPLTDAERAAMARHHAAIHGVQSAIALEITRLGENRAGADAKHLRVGINSAMSDAGGLAELLIAKGVFTRAEYFEAIARAAERELESMTKRVRQSCGLPDSVTFG